MLDIVVWHANDQHHVMVVAPACNGSLGTLQQWSAKKGRWSVTLDGGKQISVKPDNLEPRQVTLDGNLPVYAMPLVSTTIYM